MNECGSSKQQLMTLYKQLNYDVVSKIKEWKDNNVLLYQKIIDCCETTNGNLSDIADILDEYIVILSDCCRTINGNLTLILEGAEQICIECVHLPATTTTTEECEPGTTEEPDITTEEPTYTTSEPGPEECDQPTEFHDKGTFYPYMVEKFLGTDTGMVTLDFETYDIPDRFVVVFGGVAVIDTGYHGDPIFEPRLNAALALLGVAPVSVNASQVGQASFIKTTAEDHAFVFVYAPLRNTAFNLVLSCPYNTSTTSTSTTTTTTEEEITTTSSEETDTTTARPCTLDVEVLFPPQPIVTTSSTEEPVSTTSTTFGCPEESCGYGLLYNQPAIQDERNIANTGWHVPTYEEAKEMLIAHGGSEFIDGGYKYTGIEPSGELQFMDTDPDYWYEGAAGTNTTCFSARGGSYRYDVDGGFYNLNYWATWWLAESGYWMSLEPTVLFSAGNSYAPAPNTGMGLRLVMDNPEEWYCGMLYTGNNGDTYSTVKIGDQVWLGENLRETKYRSGANITEITDNTEWVAATEGALCAYDNDWLENICMDRPCYIPDNYTSEFILFGSISLTGGPPFTSFIATLEDACQAVYDYTYNGGTFQANYDPAVSRYYSSEDYWRVNDLVYDVETCELVATGYYIMHIQGTGHKIVYIVDGMIVSYPECPEITTTSSTEEPVTTTTEEPPIDAFIFEIESGAETIELPLHSNDDDGNVATYDAYVYWDYENYPHTSEHITTASASHTYSVAGTYVVVIEGTCQTFATRSKTDTATHPIAPKITRVLKWGNTADFRLLNFYGCVNLTDLPHDVSGNPYGSSEGVITCAANINTFENFLWTCVAYTHGINYRLFENCASVVSFKNTFAYSGVTGNIPGLLFDYNPGVTSFEGTFRNTNLGDGGYSLNGYLFWNNTLATNFSYTFFNTKFSTPIPGSIFTRNTLAEDFSYTFARSSYSSSPKYWYGSVEPYLFQSAGANALKFTGTFQNSNIRSETGSYTINPDYLFAFNTNAQYFNRTFFGCKDLKTGVFRGTAHDSLFWNNTNAVTFAYCFGECWYITDKLIDCPNLFKYAGASVSQPLGLSSWESDFFATFTSCSGITGDLPVELFKENVNAKYFTDTFYCGGDQYGSLGIGGTGIIPADLFRYNTKAIDFQETFRRQHNLTLAPNGLFQYNLLANSFIRTFEHCWKLAVEKYVFSEVFASTTDRFNSALPGHAATVDFTYTFDLLKFYGTSLSRTAPEIWDTGKYIGLVAKGHNNTFRQCRCELKPEAYSNFADIPCDWKDCSNCPTDPAARCSCPECTTTTTTGEL